MQLEAIPSCPKYSFHCGQSFLGFPSFKCLEHTASCEHSGWPWWHAEAVPSTPVPPARALPGPVLAQSSRSSAQPWVLQEGTRTGAVRSAASGSVQTRREMCSSGVKFQSARQLGGLVSPQRVSTQRNTRAIVPESSRELLSEPAANTLQKGAAGTSASPPGEPGLTPPPRTTRMVSVQGRQRCHGLGLGIAGCPRAGGAALGGLQRGVSGVHAGS